MDVDLIDLNFIWIVRREIGILLLYGFPRQRKKNWYRWNGYGDVD